MPIPTLEIVSTLKHVKINSSFKAEVLQYLNHTVNFFCYCISGLNSRNEAKSFMIHF